MCCRFSDISKQGLEQKIMSLERASGFIRLAGDSVCLTAC
jgi:hypothetical protein